MQEGPTLPAPPSVLGGVLRSPLETNADLTAKAAVVVVAELVVALGEAAEAGAADVEDIHAASHLAEPTARIVRGIQSMDSLMDLVVALELMPSAQTDERLNPVGTLGDRGPEPHAEAAPEAVTILELDCGAIDRQVVDVRTDVGQGRTRLDEGIPAKRYAIARIDHAADRPQVGLILRRQGHRGVVVLHLADVGR